MANAFLTSAVLRYSRMIPGSSAAPSAGPSPASNMTKNAEIRANTDRMTANSHPHGWSVHSAQAPPK